MTIIESKIAFYEDLLLKNKQIKIAWGIALRYYEYYRLGNEQSAQKALRAALSAYKANASSAWLLLFCAFFHGELGNTDSADEMITGFKAYRNYYKNNQPEVYAIYCYVQAIIDLKLSKTKGVKKQLKTLLDFNEKYGGYYVNLMIADIYFRQKNHMSALDHLELAYEGGCRSFYLYILYYDLIAAGAADDNGYLFVPFLKWAKAQDCLKDFIIDKNEKLIDELFDSNISVFEDIYKINESDLLLNKICRQRITKNDVSQEAYGYYKKAELKQLDIFGLTEMLMKCAYTCRDEAVNLYSMHLFLEKYEIDIELMPYIFHLLLTNKKFANLIDEFGLKNKILQFGVHALTNKLEGKWYNSIYVYLLFNLDNEAKLEANIEKILYKDLFVYEIIVNNFNSGYIWSLEKEKSSMSTYKLENGRCKINSATGNFRVVILDNEQKNIIDNKYKTERMVGNADRMLYKHFLGKGYEDLNLYIALASIFVNSDSIEEEHIYVLNKTLSVNLLSQGFRMQVGAALGNILSQLQRHDNALEYFNEVNESLLNDRYIEIMLTAFINAGELNKAYRLIVKKREFISDRTLLWALKQLACNKDFHSQIADPAYELIIKNWYDAKLLSIVIQYYIGSQEDWLILREVLEQMSVSDISLDEKILANSLWMHDFSSQTQNVFRRLYKMESESKLVENFIYYTCYEMCINLAKPEYEVITILEKEFKQKGDRLLAYALARVYMNHSVATFQSNEILEKTVGFMEEDNLILPEFKDIKDKNLLTAYIEKNQPFMYRSSSDKKVVLYYKIDGYSEFSRREMQHKAFGVFFAVMPLFYNEEITYFFSEEMKSGSINTKEFTITNNKVKIKTQTNDTYFLINNALIYDQMFKYGEAEKIITDLLKNSPRIRGRII